MNQYINRRSIIFVTITFFFALVIILIFSFINTFATVVIHSNSSGVLRMEDTAHKIKKGKTELPWIKKDTYGYEFRSKDITLFGTIDTRFQENLVFNTKIYSKNFIEETVYETFDHIDMSLGDFLERYPVSYRFYGDSRWLVAKVILDENSHSNIWLIFNEENNKWDLVTRTSAPLGDDGGFSIPSDVLVLINKEINND